MDSIFTKKIKFIIKMKISSNSTSLDSKINTVLGQRRMNGSEILNFFKAKVSELNINDNSNILLNVWVIVFELDDYLIYIKMPSLTTLINKVLYLNKNFNVPGYICNLNTKKGIFNYTLTPYIIYEVVRYKYNYENLDSISLESFYKKNVSSLKSKGINILFS